MHYLKNFFLLVFFLFVSLYSSGAQLDINALDSVVNSPEQQNSKPEEVNENKAIRLTLDSLGLLYQSIHQKLDSQSTIPKDSLVRYRTVLIDGQELAGQLRQRLLQNNKDAIDSTGITTEATALYFKLGTTKNRVEERIRKQDNLMIKEKAGYIWEAPLIVKPADFFHSLTSLINKPGISDHSLNDSQWSNLFFLLLLSVGFFYWLLKNKKKALASASNSLTFKALPLSETLLFLLVTLPLIDQNITARYIEIIHFLMLLLVYWRFRSTLQMQGSSWWIVLIGLYILLILFNYMIMSNGFIIRSGLIGLNGLALAMGFIFVRRLKQKNKYKTSYKLLFFLYCFLMTLAIFLNLIGQINVSKSTSITAIIGIVQVIGLIALGKIIVNALNVQIERYHENKSALLRLNQTNAVPFIQKSLFFIGILVWLRVLLINLNVLEGVSALSTAILESPHALGSFTFTFRNLINFAIIVAIANWLQKNLESFFTNQTTGKRFDAPKDQSGSKITLVRLAVIILGFFFGVTALGISMIKLTVIIGALSVGIGLGMQNIFNNFVSGVILIFEKPFNIGDLIELGGQKGRVEKIGIRSSTLLTEQGSEIIIPNGDLLSGRVVNYTYSDDYIKTEFTLKVAPTVDVEQLKKLINEEVAKSKSTVQKLPVEILYSSISPSDRTFKIQCWIKNIYLEAQFKSNLMEALSSRFSENEIVSLS